MRAKTVLLVLLSLLFITGCSSPAPRYDTRYQKKYEHPVSNNPIVNELHEQYKKWHHTPYKYGGVCLDGVDCSGLVERIYLDGFGLKLPRTTNKQMHLGKWVSRSKLKPGDLIFFKTGVTRRHVGIYFGGNTFLHASTHYGVIISSLSNPYWRKRYYTARRILRTAGAYTAKN